MAKLSAHMISALRMLARGEQPPAGPTRAALLRRGYAKWDAGEPTRSLTVEITQDGRDALDEIERGERAAALDERLSRTVPAGPSVRLTPAPADTKREATDAEVLQLLAVLDAGEIVHRALYQGWGVLDAPFTLNLDAVNRAARDAVRFGLVRQTFKDREYVLTAEPVHLDAGKGYTACGWSTVASAVRLRVTSDPAKVTHERCK